MCSSMTSNELVSQWLQNIYDELTPPESIDGHCTYQKYLTKRKRSKDSSMEHSNASDSSRSPKKRTKTQAKSDTFSSQPDSIASLSVRTRLTPRSQASSRPRSDSPTKDLHLWLRESTPKVVFHHPEEAYWTETMTELAKRLGKKLEEGVIPVGLKNNLLSMYPGTKTIPDSAFKTAYQGSGNDINALWTRANRIYLEAKACYSYGQDENAWCMKVTQRVLSYGLSESGVDFFELNSIQSQSIDSSYLPASRTPGLINKKADYALVYSPNHPEIAGVYRPLLLDGYTLSQMTDTYTKHLVMASGAAVKPAHGNSVEALAQLATWFASGFTKIRELNIEAGEEAGIDELHPMIGYTVVGHIWDTYMACDLETDGERVVSMVGPLIGLSASTASMHDIFKLLALMEGVKVYARDVHWPWLKRTILEPLL